jgi:hypothetical protein
MLWSKKQNVRFPLLATDTFIEMFADREAPFGAVGGEEA